MQIVILKMDEIYVSLTTESVFIFGTDTSQKLKG